MSFKANLEIDGSSYRVLGCSYRLERDIDQFGKPTSGVRGGTIAVTIESSSDTSFIEWIVTPKTRKGGKIVFEKTDEDASLKELEFEDAYIISQGEEFGPQGQTGMVESIVISAKRIIMGSAEHENDWPS